MPLLIVRGSFKVIAKNTPTGISYTMYRTLYVSKHGRVAGSRLLVKYRFDPSGPCVPPFRQASVTYYCCIMHTCGPERRKNTSS